MYMSIKSVYGGKCEAWMDGACERKQCDLCVCVCLKRKKSPNSLAIAVFSEKLEKKAAHLQVQLESLCNIVW